MSLRLLYVYELINQNKIKQKFELLTSYEQNVKINTKLKFTTNYGKFAKYNYINNVNYPLN